MEQGLAGRIQETGEEPALPIGKQQLFGPLYRPLVRARHSRLIRMASGLVQFPAQYARFRSNRPYLAADIRGPVGMGAALAQALLLLRCAEARGLIPMITSTNPLYSVGAGQDCFAPYFGTAGEAGYKGLKPLRFTGHHSVPFLRMDQGLPIEEASRLFWTYLPPTSEVSAIVESILEPLAGGRFDLGIHYRGTDKMLEAEPVSFKAFEAALGDHVAAGGRLDTAFLATDDPSFEASLRRRHPRTNFLTYTLGQPSNPKEARHFSDMPAHDKALEAAVNMMLLGAAPACIRSSSYMSAISKIAYPSLRTTTLNRTFGQQDQFPERQILEEELARGVSAAAGQTRIGIST